MPESEPSPRASSAAVIAVEPVRLFDSRATGQLSGGQTVDIDVGSVAGGLPMAGVVLNVTSVEADAPGFITVWPCGSARPTTSNLNFERGGAVANMAVVGVGNDNGSQSVCLFTSAPSHLVVDAIGWAPVGRGFQTAVPRRMLDTRNAVPVQAGIEREVDLSSVVPSDVAAVSLNVTAVHPRSDGWISVRPCGTNPNTSTVNFGRGSTTAAGVVVGATNRRICVFSSADTDVLVDVTGWTTGGATMPVPQRALDTRLIGRLRSGQHLRVALAPHGVPADSEAVFITVTAVNASADGYLTVFPCGQLPYTSNLNFERNNTRANAVTARVSADTSTCIYSSAETDVLVDVTGWAS